MFRFSNNLEVDELVSDIDEYYENKFSNFNEIYYSLNDNTSDSLKNQTNNPISNFILQNHKLNLSFEKNYEDVIISNDENDIAVIEDFYSVFNNSSSISSQFDINSPIPFTRSSIQSFYLFEDYKLRFFLFFFTFIFIF
jgi:hypothetical protein